ncbi:MAG: prepilin-type N-terminal cleavage/methylation domain-containing protein [Proteobacteria bacterium]|nr:prepilin-type N-terminal cleavage/methylation domain-containing protein [Pseudomonadota bacterium]
MSVFRKQKGVTLIELLMASTIGLVVFLATMQYRQMVYKEVRKTSDTAAVMAEHTALQSLVSAIPLSEAFSVFCGSLKHPFGKYSKYKDGSDGCEAVSGQTINSAKLAAWDQLSTSYFDFAWGEANRRAEIPSTLSADDFDSKVSQKIDLAGCTDCHKAGGTAPVFNPANLLTPLGLGTSFGRRLLRSEMSFPSIRDPSRYQVTHTLRFISNHRSIQTVVGDFDDFGCFPAVLERTNCTVMGVGSGCRSKSGVACSTPVCPSGMKWPGVRQCVCSQTRQDKKGNVTCVQYKTTWNCWKHDPNLTVLNAQCPHGEISITPPVFILDRPNCLPRYSGSGAYQYWSKWSCRQPNSEYANQQKRWDVTYELESRWTSIEDPLPRRMLTTGALK